MDHIDARRRKVFLALGAAIMAGALPARGQPRTPHRVAFLAGGSRGDASAFLPSFLEGLRILGYREGENLLFDPRYANYSAGEADKLAAEIAALKPAVIVANGGGILPAYRLSPPIPLVFLHSGDPVDAGMVESFGRPGRHATGISLLALDLIGKRLELLKQVNPKLRRVAFLASPEHAGQRHELAAAQAAAKQFGLEVAYHEARTPAQLAKALDVVATQKPDGALLFSDALMIGQRDVLSAFFLKHRIPSVAGWSGFADSGHVLSYGPERRAAWKRLAYFVDRILRGARPGDLPVELPTEVEMVVNRRSASAMKLPLSPEIVLRANRVIE